MNICCSCYKLIKKSRHKDRHVHAMCLKKVMKEESDMKKEMHLAKVNSGIKKISDKDIKYVRGHYSYEKGHYSSL